MTAMQSLDEKTWGVFQLEAEFECAKGIYLPTGDVTDGDVPFITAKAGNNGLTRFIGMVRYLVGIELLSRR